MSIHNARILSLLEASSILKATNNQQPDTDRRRWLTRKDQEQLLAAVDQDEPTVHLPDYDREFKIKYENGSIFVKPTNGFAPCARITVASLRRELDEVRC